MTTFRKKIIARPENLEDLNGITVNVSPDQKTVTVLNSKHKALSFKFRWLKDHFAGYFYDPNMGGEKKSKAVLALWKPIDAIHFASSYAILADLRAMRRRPNKI